MLVEFAPDFSAIYVPEIYYSRGTRGERTDIVAIYDTTHLENIGEVIIPPKRATGMPHRAYQGISDDGRFVYVANMTPATSVSVVDVTERRFVGEIEIAGCNLIYPTGNRSFATLCGDGTLGLIELDEQGNVKSKTHSAKFFDPDKDPPEEKASRHGDTWLFFRSTVTIHPVKFGVAKSKSANVGRCSLTRSGRRTGKSVVSSSTRCIRVWGVCTSSCTKEGRMGIKKAAKTCGSTTSRRKKASGNFR